MSNYIEENDYYYTYGGKIIPPAEFKKYAIKASNEVKLRIFNKPITGYEEAIKSATCSVADILYSQSQKEQTLENIVNGTTQVVTSEKVGDYSKNYASTSASELLKSIENTSEKINEEIEKNLLFTGLLYSGVIDVR